MAMRKVILILFAGVIWFRGGSGIALADGMMLPLPGETDADYVAVRYHHVEVRVENGHAVTRVEQEFYNPHDFPVQSQYLFPIPPEAMLTSFQATVDGQPQVMRRQDPAATNEALNAVVAQQRDPSLLAYTDWESLALDLDLSPGASRKMSLEYEEVLAPSGGLYRYRYVLGTERYSYLPLEEVSVSVEVESSQGLASLYSPSHPVVTQRQGATRAQVRWEAEGVRPSEDFELYYAPADAGFGGGLLTGQRDGHDHFLFVFSPSLEQRQAETLPKDIVFVIDRSGSMDGEKMEQARNALHFVLGQLGENDRFSVVAFDDRLRVLDWNLLPAEQGSLRDARRFVDRLAADGSTDLEAALQAGLEILERGPARSAPRMVVFLTDGLPTAGVTDGALIAQLVGRSNADVAARMHVFGVGYDVNSHLLDRLAAENGGTVTYVQPGENLVTALTGFYEGIARPVLTDVQVEFEGLEASDQFPAEIPDLFQGSSLLLTGRYQAAGSRATVHVRGRAGEDLREYVYHFDLAETGQRDFVPRLWATRYIGALLDEVRIEGESAALVQEMRMLGLAYGLVTPYTTFVIQGQLEGAASADNMALYERAEVNQAWGQTTIMARVQNQAYQQAAQANLATGANVYNEGKRSLAQVGMQNLDLALLLDHSDAGTPVDSAWIEDNVQIDSTITFGTEAYFELARDPEARPYLQSGTNVIFGYQGQVIAIRDGLEDDSGKMSQHSKEQVPTTGAGPQDPNGPYGGDPRIAPGGKMLARWAQVLLQILASTAP
jgi:Ca-activated chloride channel family protein